MYYTPETNDEREKAKAVLKDYIKKGARAGALGFGGLYLASIPFNPAIKEFLRDKNRSIPAKAAALAIGLGLDSLFGAGLGAIIGAGVGALKE